MPYRLWMEQGLLRISFFGRLERAEFQRLAEEVMALEASFPFPPDRLTDMSEMVGSELTQSDMSDLVARRKSRTFSGSFRSAVVAARPVQMGYARMFQILNDHPQITVAVFATVEEAQQWLAPFDPGNKS